ncbi:MAG TPA: type II toxin-antitoxin system HicB family antitoxin [Ktedonobacterales bacterium]|nr:type II toxin-antitoxin system HicB family antitoxin [Ktedonobacterales bacterium]
MDKEHAMFAEYLAAAMQHAHYEFIDEDGLYFGAIDELPGTWADGKTREACQAKLESVAEGWILLAIARHEDLPVFDGHKLTVAKVGD